MPKYMVRIDRKIIRQVEIEVEAEDFDAAWMAGEELAAKREFDWNEGGGDGAEVAVDDVEVESVWEVSNA